MQFVASEIGAAQEQHSTGHSLFLTLEGVIKIQIQITFKQLIKQEITDHIVTTWSTVIQTYIQCSVYVCVCVCARARTGPHDLTKLYLYLHQTSVTAFNSPLEDTAFLQQLYATWVGRKSTQEEEVMLAECIEKTIAL